MNKIVKIVRIIVLLVMVTAHSGCSDYLTTNSSTDISDVSVLSSASNLNMVLTSAYRKLYFNFNDGERVYAGLTGMQMYVDLGGSDIICHTNMGSTQLQAYQYEPVKTQFNGSSNSRYIWTMMYKIINQVNIILDNLDSATGEAALKNEIKGQALAIRAICYFHLIQNYQQTYMIAKSKPGVILRTSSSDPVDMGRSTVEKCYEQILIDLNASKALLQNFTQPNKWTIDKYIVSGMLARTYLLMNNWTKALEEASITYNRYNTLMTKEQYRSGFDKVITSNIAEVAWAVKFTDTDNLGGGTQYNFWFNQDESYGEGYSDGPIYAFLTFFADGQFEKLFEKGEDRYQFWKRSKNPSKELSTKWAYDKYKHYGDKNGAVGGNTRPEVSLMRGSEMLLIMAEASAQLDNGQALTYLNRLQTARNVQNITTAASGTELLEAIYIERRKELLCEGVTGFYDLLRLQKPLVRICESDSYPEGHYTWGVSYLNEYVPSSAAPFGKFNSNDYRFLCQIPEMEMTNNNGLSESDQNPFSGN